MEKPTKEEKENFIKELTALSVKYNLFLSGSESLDLYFSDDTLDKNLVGDIGYHREDKKYILYSK